MKKILFVMIITFSSCVTAQRVKVISGDYNFLKDQKFIKVVFNYKGLTFTRKKITEEQYITDRMSDIESAGGKDKAQKWKDDWEYSKAKTFQDKFLASWNKNTKIEASPGFEMTKYTLIVEPTWISQGAFIGLGNIPAQMNSTITFVETNNPQNVLMVVEGIKATGDNVIGIPNNNDRIAECFAKTSKMLALKVDYYTRK